jgi:hypothetical protein
MSNYRTRKQSLRRYVRLILEELECRYVPSFLGVQLELPLAGALSPVSLTVGIATAPTGRHADAAFARSPWDCPKSMRKCKWLAATRSGARPRSAPRRG